MNITLNLEQPMLGASPLEFPRHSFKAFWTDDGRIAVLAVVERQDGGFHIMQDIINPPLTDEDRNQIDASNQHQERE